MTALALILAGQVMDVTGRDDLIPLIAANDTLGGSFLSRLNMDLREDKSWSYGVRSSVASPVGPRSYTVVAPVQSDRTGDSIKVLLAQMRAFPGSKPVEPVELNRVTDGNIRDEVLANAPDAQHGFFAVPKVIE